MNPSLANTAAVCLILLFGWTVVKDVAAFAQYQQAKSAMDSEIWLQNLRDRGFLED